MKTMAKAIITDGEEAPSLPSGWQSARLGEFCRQDRSIVEPQSAEAALRPYLSLEHIESGTGRILREPEDAPEDEGKSMTFAFDERHVLYGKLRPYLNKVALPNFKGRCTTELIPLLPEPGVSRAFVAWLLRRPATVSTVMQEKTGSRMPRANIDHLMDMLVCVPTDRAEQEALTAILEQKMNQLHRLKALYEEQMQLIDQYAFILLDRFPERLEE